MTRSWLALTLLVAGCSDDSDTEAGLPAGITGSGTFAVVTTIDLTVGAVLPEPAVAYLDILRGLRDDPGGTFFELLEDAGLPLVDELRAALPDAVEGKVGDWIDDAIPAEVDAEIDALLDATEVAIARFDVLSDLELPAPDQRGRVRATHRVTALRFGDQQIAVPASDTPPFVTAVTADAVFSRAAGGQAGDARLAIGDHSFGLRHGEYIYALLEAHAMARLGLGLRAALGEIVDCPAVAVEVASKCILSVCVGHEAELEMLCERGLDEAVARLRKKLEELRFDAVRYASGSAAMWDAAPKDGVLERLDGGVWQATLNLGMGPRTVPSVFTAARR